MILDFLFPKTCVGCKKIGSYLCEQCFSRVAFLEKQYCPVCFKAAVDGFTHPICRKNLGLDGLISLVYFDSPVRELVYQLKYRLVSDLVKEIVSKFSFKQLPKDFEIITSVPLYKSKENYRGFNQSEILAKAFAEKLSLNYQGLLERVKPTLQQARLTKNQRKKNLEKAFVLKNSVQVKGKNIFVFDDVWTTGFTLKSAAKELKKAGADKVLALSFARSH